MARVLTTNRKSIPALQNLIPNPDDITAGTWTDINLGTTINGLLDPFGGNNAQQVVTNTGSGLHGYEPTSMPIIGQVYTISEYFKARPGSTNWLAFDINNGGAAGWFDPATGTIGTVQSGLTMSVIPAANGFFRLTATYLCTAVAGEFILIVQAGDQSNIVYPGTGNEGFIRYRFQRVKANWSGVPVTGGISIVNTGDLRNVVVNRQAITNRKSP